MRLPSGRSPREARYYVLEAGPLHNNLKKGWSEPQLVGKVIFDFELEVPRSQEYSLGTPERQSIEVIGGNPCSRRSSENDYRF